jgi:hypothetical protein
MILLYIYLAVFVLTLLMFSLWVIGTSQEFKRRYPNTKVPKRHWSEFVFAVLKMGIMAMIPLFNMIMLWVIMIKSEEMREDTILKIYLKYSTEGEQNETQEE